MQLVQEIAKLRIRTASLVALETSLVSATAIGPKPNVSVVRNLFDGSWMTINGRKVTTLFRLSLFIHQFGFGFEYL